MLRFTFYVIRFAAKLVASRRPDGAISAARVTFSRPQPHKCVVFYVAPLSSQPSSRRRRCALRFKLIAAQLVASRRPDGVRKARQTKRPEAQLVASRRPDGVKKARQTKRPEAQLVGSHRPDGVTFVVIVTSEKRRSNIKRKT